MAEGAARAFPLNATFARHYVRLCSTRGEAAAAAGAGRVLSLRARDFIAALVGGEEADVEPRADGPHGAASVEQEESGATGGAVPERRRALCGTVWLSACADELLWRADDEGEVAAAAATAAEGALRPRPPPPRESEAARWVLDALARVVALPDAPPAAWRMYLRTEYTFGVAGAARRHLSDALERCPWAKALWLDAADALRGVHDVAAVDELLRDAEHVGVRFERPWGAVTS